MRVDDEPGWTSEIARPDIERALRAAGLRGDRAARLCASSPRNASGRVARLARRGLHAVRKLPGTTSAWRSAASPDGSRLKSTAFEIDRTSAGYRFTRPRLRTRRRAVRDRRRPSRRARRDRGPDPEVLLSGTHASAPFVPAVPTTTSAERRRRSAGRARSADVALALPAAEERERAVVTQLVRRAATRSPQATGVAAPPPIRVTVHPIGRELRPRHRAAVVGLGRDRRRRDRSAADHDAAAAGPTRSHVRHEVAHVLLDERAGKRPMWVREGAALYFADSDSAPGPSRHARHARETTSSCARCPPARTRRLRARRSVLSRAAMASTGRRIGATVQVRSQIEQNSETGSFLMLLRIRDSARFVLRVQNAFQFVGMRRRAPALRRA